MAADPAFDPQPDSDARYQTANRWLKAAFGRWAAEVGSDVDPGSCEELLHYKRDYLDGHLTRWSQEDLDRILLELFPAKVIADEDLLDAVIGETIAFLVFLADTGLLDPNSDDPASLQKHVRAIEPRFRDNMADASRHSPGKRFWAAAGDAGIDPNNAADINAFINDFNNRPAHHRDATHAPHPTTGRTTPPGTHPRPKANPRRRRRR